jgi:hypothetical protein
MYANNTGYKRSKHSIFTFHPERDHEITMLFKWPNCSYIIVGREFEEDGRPLLTGYVFWKYPKCIETLTYLFEGRMTWGLINRKEAPAWVNKIKLTGDFGEKGRPPRNIY